MTRYTAAFKALAAALLTAATLAACGGSSAGGSSDTTAGSKPPAQAESGAQVFSSAGCAGCHTLAAAHSSGTIGPNLNSLKPSYTAVLHQVEHGGGAMPSFAKSLTAAQIRAVAHFVADSTH